MSTWVWDDCEACYRLGAELCPDCTAAVALAAERALSPEQQELARAAS